MRHHPTALLTLALSGFVWLGGCTELPALQANNVCGNGIIEPANDEDCEPGKSLPDGLTCGEANDELGCHFVCGDDDGELSDSSACPVGWGCAYEGFCQPPSGQFVEQQIISGITTPLGIGDFDGDDFPDIATVQEPVLSIAYGNINTLYQVDVRAPIDASPGDPVIGDLDRDGLTDLVVYAGERVHLFSGTESQSLAPFMVPTGVFPGLPTQRRLVAVTRNEVFARQQAALLALDLDAGLLGVQLATGGGEDEDVLELPVSGTALPRAVASADLFGADGVHELAIAPHRGRQVVLVSMPCAEPDGPEVIFDGEAVTPGCHLVESARVQAPGNWELSDAGTFAADLDGDGALDLLFGLQGPQGQAVAAALGDGAGGLAQPFVLPIEYDGPRPSEAPVMPGAQVVMAPPPWLLAVADLDGDGLGDVVTSSAVMHGRADGVDAPISFVAGYETSRRWDRIEVVDLNRDGELDLVAVSGSSLLIHLNVGDALFNEAETTLTGEELEISVGDFDGDLYPDVLVEVAGLLLIGFNDGRGLTESLEEVLATGSDVTAVALRSTASGADAIDDVVVLQEQQGATLLFEVQGSGTRRLAAPFVLESPIEAILSVQDPEGGALGLILESADGEQTFRSVDQPALEASLSTKPPALDADEACFPANGGELLWRSYRNRENTGYEHAVIIETSSPGPMSYGGPWIPRILIYDGDDGLDCAALDPSPLSGLPHTLRVADIDGDGPLDLLVGHTADRRPESGAVQGGLSIYWGNRQGGFESTPETFELAGTQNLNTGEAAQFSGPFDALQTDVVRGAELVMAFDNGLYLLHFDPETREASALVQLARQRLGAQDIGRIDAVDFDLDGVTDILLSGPRQSSLLLQAPCTAQDAAEEECLRTVKPREVPDE